MLVTPVFDIVSVFGVAAAAANPIPVLEMKLSISLSTISIAVPPFTLYCHLVYDPEGVAHTLSPLKNLVLFGVPVAERSAVTVTAPVVAAVGVKSMNEPFVVFTVVTPEPVPSISIQAVPL